MILTASMVSIFGGGILLLETLPDVERLTSIIHLPRSVVLAAPPLIVAILAAFVLTKTLSSARIVITTAGLRYAESGVTRSCAWDAVSNISYVCGRGGGSFHVDIIGDRSPMCLKTSLFGVSRSEFESVTTAARGGILLNVAQRRAKIETDAQRGISKPSVIGIVSTALIKAIYIIIHR